MSAETRPLSAGGPLVAPISLGAMMFGDQTDAAASEAILERYLGWTESRGPEGGKALVDTADAYSAGASERIIGDWMARTGARDRLLLATKVGNPTPGVEGGAGISARWIKRGLEMSCERLRTDRVDLYYLHIDDETTPLEETIGALGELVAAGRIGLWGFSNHRAWKIAEMVRVADAIGAPRPSVCQPYHHLLNREAEMDLLPACRHFGIGVIPYSPLARGVLTGKYRAETPEGSRADRGDRRMLEVEFYPETLALAAKAADWAAGKGLAPAALALNWLWANDAVSCILAGPRTLDQLAGYFAAADAPYDAEDEAFLSALCPSGRMPVPGHADPRYPYRGRRTRFDAVG